MEYFVSNFHKYYVKCPLRYHGVESHKNNPLLISGSRQVSAVAFELNSLEHT
jgi:hypothetical protein